jgi:hypothetical protein
MDPGISIERKISQAWNMGIAGIACAILLGWMPWCGAPFAIAGAIFGFKGLNHANDAKRFGSPSAQAPIVFNAVVLVVSILAVLGSCGLRHVGPW